MKRLVFLAVLAVMGTVAGCQPRQVEFSRDGVPHCPYCLVAVAPLSNRCPREECGREYLWAASPVVCWRCGGAKICPECEGTGNLYRVQTVEAEGGVAVAVARPDCYFCGGKGYCVVCGETGFVTYGQPAMGRSE